MTNSDIADLLKLYADLSELHGGNAFKIKSYASASFRIDKLPIPLAGKSLAELEQIDGVGKSIAVKVDEMLRTETFPELQELLEQTPEGVMQIMKIKGIGPKKVAMIWKELGIESVGELLYACKENRLAQAKGFGLKTQAAVLQQIEFMFANAHKFHYAKAEGEAQALFLQLSAIPDIQVSFSGDYRRAMEVLEKIELLIGSAQPNDLLLLLKERGYLSEATIEGETYRGKLLSYPTEIHVVESDRFFYTLYMETGSQSHLEKAGMEPTLQAYVSEEALYSSMNAEFIEPERREGTNEWEAARNHKQPKLITFSDLKGPLHNHSTWSDGLNSVAEMAQWCIDKGYAYLGMADHSKSAFYANGLKEDRVVQQQKEIDQLNTKLAPFKIFKGIECDILNDGSLDYENDILSTFDYVVASVHSNLKMTEEKAMTRLLKAIENPYTTILGHPTGRLLLMREGYPIDHKKIIDACAANKVVIEINANPYRLDIDWRHIEYALTKGVKLSINPDAHELEGFMDMHYGTLVARKGGLTASECLNAMPLIDIENWFSQKRSSAKKST